jgi:serine/threonine protein kinase/Tol biopolymer transport system component
MTLSAGTNLGPYEIVAPLGAGGMGEVYRGRDSKLSRDVALKVIPAEFANDRDRMARFEREAKVLASLNHPNIAHIYGLEDSAGVRALVMELVEGPTLAERIAKGPIPLEESLNIAQQIAGALEYAHDRGIIHRDLKPANVKIIPEGAAKVLDFGLAKALDESPAAGDIINSPTLTMGATRAGVILGTAAYMSPEQARGKSADRRADIWAFGVVLYEMLSGIKLYAGETAQDTLAHVITKEPAWESLPATTPTPIRHLIERCLTKDPKSRLQAIGEARIIIERYHANPGASTSSIERIPAQESRSRRSLPWLVAGICFLVALSALVWMFSSHNVTDLPIVAAQILPPPGTGFSLYGTVGFGPPLLSPDGSKLAFVAAGPDGRRKLWVRPLQSIVARALEGTDGASMQFWSPDSQNLGFFANGKMKRISAAGGSPLDLADVGGIVLRGGAWGAYDIILYSPTPASGLYKVSANTTGVAPQPVTTLNISRKEASHRWPQFLPDGKHFLFYINSSTAENAGTYVGSVNGSDPKLIFRSNRIALYAPPGYLLFLREAVLMAQPFDPNSFQLSGDPAPLLNHALGGSAAYYAGNFSVSSVGGFLVYDGGDASAASAHLSWYDRSGTQLADLGLSGEFESPRISPDGKKLAVTVIDPVTSAYDIWIQDLQKGTRSRLTFEQGSVNVAPAWSPDGKTIMFQSNMSRGIALYQMPSDGSGNPALVYADPSFSLRVPRLSGDGRYLVFHRQSISGSPIEIWALPLFGDRKPFPIVQGHTDSSLPDFSPDGKWLAYVSSESGRNEIYVVPFGHPGAKHQVSTDGGDLPRWRADGKELFFLSPDDKMMSAEIVESENDFETGKIQSLFQTHAFITASWSYDVSADGKRFVIETRDPHAGTGPITLITNWPGLLKQK